MITIEDSFKLASIKFKTRKIRNFLTGFSISIAVLTLIIFLIISTAIKSFFYNNFETPLDKKSIITENFRIIEQPKYEEIDESLLNDPVYLEQIRNANLESTNLDPNFVDKEISFAEYDALYPDTKFLSHSISRITDPNIISVSSIETFEKKVLNFNLIGTKTDGIFQDRDFVYNLIDKKFIEDFDKESDIIPILITSNKFWKEEKVSNNDSDFLDKYKKFYNKYIGTEININFSQNINSYQENSAQNNVKKSIKFKIVGLVNNAKSTGNNETIILPNWYYENNQETKEFFKVNNFVIYSELNNEKEATEFITKYDNSNSFKSLSISLTFIQRFEALICFLASIFFGITIFLFIIAGFIILTTVAKIASDSKKEVGVFRAIGSQRFDIIKIFSSYIFLLVSTGYILGLIISYIIVYIVSITSTDNLIQEISSLVNIETLVYSNTLLVSFPIFELTILYLITLVIGLIASGFPILMLSKQDPIKALREE